MRIVLLFFRYNWFLVEHKCHVLWFGIIRVGGIPLWNLLVHDLTKFSRKEYLPRFRRFFLRSITAHDPAWLGALSHHLEHNEHHWEFWCIHGRASPIPEVYVREMVADWLAVNHRKRRKEESPPLPQWLKEEYPRMQLHPRSVARLIRILESVGVRQEEWLPQTSVKRVA